MRASLRSIGRGAAMAALVLTSAGAALAQQPPASLHAATRPAAPIHADVAAAFTDSLKLLLTEHAVRVSFQEKTRRELAGPFWQDYLRSVRVPEQWEDTDSWLVNYVGHPIHGAAAGFIWMHHDPRSRREEFGLNRSYWASRWRPIAWSAAYSLQFEIGPLSEASIGNVGLLPKTTGWVDYLVTPAGALALMVGEDALDRYFVKWVESKTSNRVARASLRMIFGPGRTLANLSVGEVPWRRGNRPVGWR